MKTLQFYFDCSSPWTYLAFHNVQPMAREIGAGIDWKPILVGGIFNTVNQTVYESRDKPHPVKSRYYKKDLQDWARFSGLKIGMPPVFPVNSVKAMRGAFVALERGILPAYARAVFEAYWGDLQDISQDDVLRPIVRQVGLDTDEFFAKIGEAKYKEALRANTDEVIARGGFGSPTMFVGDDMYFGNDRLPLVRAALLAS
jgi:2-hydroxychromene-2-carboxylate isomerase